MNTEAIGIARAFGSGTVRAIIGTDPPAGVEFSETVPAGVQWRLMAVGAVLATSAVVATRGPNLDIAGPVGGVFFHSQQGLQVAGLTLLRNWATIGGEGPGFSPVGQIPIGLVLGPGFVISSHILGLQAGDEWGAPQLIVEEWPL